MTPDDISTDDISTLLRRTASGLDVRDAPVEEIVRTGRRRARRRLVAQMTCTVAAVAAVAVLVPLGIGARHVESAAPAGCVENVAPAVLPEWARTGFVTPEPRVPFVLGDGGRILGVLFGAPLTAPPASGRANKILWVARDPAPAGPLQILAHRGDEPPVVLEVPGGPGPSTVDLPAPGCWTLELRWADRTDTLRLNYRQG